MDNQELYDITIIGAGPTGLFGAFYAGVNPHGNGECWATNGLTMTLEQCAFYALDTWCIEDYHRGLQQFCGIERAQHRSALAQRHHIGPGLQAFLRLENHRPRTGLPWFEAKIQIARVAIRAYLARPNNRLSAA